VRSHDRNFLAENGDPIMITKIWAVCSSKMGFMNRRGSSTAKTTVEIFEAKKAEFQLDTTAVDEMQEIHPASVELGPDKDHSAQGIQESRDQ